MKKATSFDKFMSSFINVIAVFIVLLPIFIFLDVSILLQKIIFIVSILIYKLFFVFANENRALGMMVMKTHWEKKYPLQKQIVHAFLYTLSFSTLLFWIIFPLDLFLANMLLLQLPFMKFTGMTLHEYLSGGMRGVKK